MDPAFLSPPSPSPPPLASPEDADITNTTTTANSNDHNSPSSTSNRNSSGSRSRAASPEIPLTLSASVMLADLPRDATAALASAGSQFFSSAAPGRDSKVVVKFKAVGSAPALQQDVCKISAGRKFEEVVRYLRRKLRCGETESVFLYVNSAFAPSLDEVVGNLHQCFKNAHDQLVVAYSITPAFG
ncbi:ubiquitin-like autophagy protein Apg12 domain-containing protein [Trichoderma aethiopicum]